MAYTAQLDAFASRLDDDVDLKTRHSVLSELLDMIETFNATNEYEYFLSTLIPIFIKQLKDVPVKFASNSPEHKLRNSVLEIIHRSAMNEIFQPYAIQILDLLQQNLVIENEDNGVLCMKIITSLHKAYKTHLSGKIQPFIDIINEIYKNMPSLVETTFNSETSSNSPLNSVQSPRPMSPSLESQSKQLNSAMISFKTLAECPITMVSLYSSYKQLVQPSLPAFIPNIIDILSLQVEYQRDARKEAESKGERLTTVSPKIKNRIAFGEFILGQVKAASFLAYIFIRGYATVYLKDHNTIIPGLILRLLQDCPSELSAARKELLHATRHILSTSFRTMFITEIDLLFDEKVLIGDGLTSYDTLRPLAYSTVADFIHNVRNELKPQQIWKTVQIYCELLKDDSLALTVQIMSAKLLLNLVERIMKLPNKSEGKQLFMIIIDAYAKRFFSLNRQYNHIMLQHDKFEKNRAFKEKESKEATERYNTQKTPLVEESSEEPEKMEELDNDGDAVLDEADTVTEELKEQKPDESLDKDTNNEIDIFNLYDFAPILINPISTTDPLKDARYLFRTLMTFLKSVIFGLKNCNPPPMNEMNAPKWNDSARIFSYEEINILRELFREGINCLRFFSTSKPKPPVSDRQAFDIAGPNLPITSSKEEKDIMEIFATIFIHIDPATFNEIVSFELEFMYSSMLDNSALLHIPQFFLASETTSANFSGLLISFLNSKLDQLGEVDIVKSNILIRLFKLCFMSVNLFPTANEGVILPHLNELILNSLKLSTTAEEPIVYFYLIRTLFRSIGGGRFENLYKEIMPLLQVLLETLNRMIQTALRPQERDIYVELCLTVPVRLSVLVPHLSYLMRPLVYALNGSQELVGQGLRTLELCVDNLTAEYFDPIIEPVIDEVMDMLWKHLRPLPYNHQHSHTTFRILGKLGGRNRRFIKPPLNLKTEVALEQEVKALFKIHGLPDTVPVSITPGLSSAFSLLEDPRLKSHYRVSAFKYLSGILKLFIDSSDIPPNFAAQIQGCVASLQQDKLEDNKPLQKSVVKDASKLDRQQELLLRLLKSLFYAVSIEEVKEEATELLKGICEHFTLIYLGSSVVKKRKQDRPFSINDNEGKVFLDEGALIDAITYALSFYIKDVRNAGLESIKTIFNTSLIIFGGSIEKVQQFPLLATMLKNFTHICYDEAYYSKLGGCLGLKSLVDDLGIPSSYFAEHQFEIVRSIFYVLRDTPSDAPNEVRETAKRLVIQILRDWNKGLSKDEISEKPFQTLVGVLVYDLANANPIVRETAQEALQTLSSTTDTTLTALIEPCKHLLLTPIFGKPLRALPFPMQIGNIDAITFCLGLDDTFLDFNEELTRLLLEALALVDAEDESLTSAHRIFEHRTSKHLVELRVVCIKLLSLALTRPEFATVQQGQPRIRILGVFFKTLCARSSEIINASHQGLKCVLQQNAKLPKELLQTGLRPMLMNLSDHKKLTVSGLEALARLLELLISYFKVEIGRKLLDHLMAWASPTTLSQISGQELDNNPTVQIILAILNIFHLLPPKAYTFMDEIMTTLEYLEDSLHRRQASPFRVPVSKFLNRFPNESLQYFMLKFNNRQMGTRFAYFVNLEECSGIRDIVKQNMQMIFQAVVSEVDPEVRCVKFANLVDIIAAVSKHDTEWFISQKELLSEVSTSVSFVVDFERQSQLVSATHFQVGQSVSKLQHIFVDYFIASPKETDFVVDFIKLVCSLNLPLTSRLEDFIFDNIVRSEDVNICSTYLSKCINLIADADECSIKCRIFFLRKIFNAILIHEGHKYGNLDRLTKSADESVAAWLSDVNTKIWRSTDDFVTDHTAGAIDSYRYELLQMSAILIKWAPQAVNEFKKEVIKFSWNYIKLEDSITKQAAYVVTSFFIAAFDTPTKIVTKVYAALLKAHQTESRFLVKQALDHIAPALPIRMAQPDSTVKEWLNWPRRVISEDGFNVTQVLNVYQFIVQHPDLFYVARDQFIPNIITAMGKLTILANPALENQVLAIELAELILKWEKRTKDEKESHKVDDSLEEKDNEEDDGTEADSSDVTSNDYSIPFGQREACVTFLIRYVCISPQRASENELGQKALGILYEFLGPKYWSEVTVKLTFFERFLLSSDLNSSNLLGYCLNALEVLGVALEWKSSEWVIANLTYLEKLLDKCLRSDNHDIQEVLQRVLRIILQAINEQKRTEEEDEDDEIKSFLTLLTNIVSEDLAGMSSVAAGVTLCWTLANYQPSTLDSLLPAIMRTFGKLYKDHISISHQGNQGANHDAANGTNSEYEAKMTTKLLEKILNLSSMRISNLGDQRRVFLSLLAQLIERSVDKEMLQKIINIVKNWVFSRTDLFPTTKEKAAILTKMMVFEIRGEPSLSKEFYQIIVDIFEDQSFSCSELTVRMEQPFLVGTRLADVPIRQKLMSILNDSLEKDINKRLYYIVREQNWEYLADYPWLNQALQLLYGSIDQDLKLSLIDAEYKVAPLENLSEGLPDNLMELDESNSEIDELINRHQGFIKKVSELKAKDILEPLVDMLYQSADTIHAAWISIFPIAYTSIPANEQMEFSRCLVNLLSKDYHIRQADSRPNVIQSILEAVGKSNNLSLAPHLVKYLGYSYNSWFPSIGILEAVESSPNENAKVREVNLDALIEMYASLQEEDMFYGLWRRRAKYFETNAALSYEQIGLWDKALKLYESAQIKARSGILPYGDSEYSLWEDNWVLCAEKLQHWDILTELAKHEGSTDLLLECGWRVADWTTDREALDSNIKTVMDVPTPRRQMFETFLCLQGYAQQKEQIVDLSKLCDEGIQLALRKWHSLPHKVGNAHIPLLHTFQQYVEFMEASQVYGSLHTTNAQNLDVKSQELKRVLQVWRERLPNTWDDINIWNDLVTWRQHAFNVINKVYMPFIPALQQANGTSNANSYAYRGYHEIAWVINRFAHVARKHNMPEVCISQLTKIYTLPNIEIQEAFLKLREQAKCHYQNPNELNTGLDVISNTNLVYFATQQKAEFFTLKGMFLSKLGAQEEANQAFATSVQIDLNLPKAWAEWGLFNDRRFKVNPNDMMYANNAISCYLQAAGLYKNGKTRKLLSRILWLISLDDATGTLAHAFDTYRGEVPVWYWITFIPQLLTSLSHKEAKLVRSVLIRIAKSYPQALHFQLRTTKEDFAVIQRQAMNAAQNAVNRQQNAANPSAGTAGAASASATTAANTTTTPANNGNSTSNSNITTPVPDNQTSTPTGQPQSQQNTPIQGGSAAAPGAPGQTPTSQPQAAGTFGNIAGTRQPWEHVEEIMGILKTAYPLLALSLESLVDQIGQRFKCNADEDAYRLAVALLNDGVQFLNRLGNPKEDAKLPPSTETNITRFAETVLPKHIRAEFEKDLVTSKPNLETYISKLRKWRDRLEDKLDRRFNKINLETICSHLSEFHYQKFEDIEVPGQYLLNKDNNSHFIKVERFLPTLDSVRGTNACYKRLKIRGHDGSLHPFAVQFPAARHCRREERIFQLFRIFNDALSRKVQSRRRNIQLTLPIAVPLSPHIRIMNDDSRDITMQSIYENFCRRKGQNRDDPFIYTIQKLRAAFDPRLPKPDLMSIRVEILSAIQSLLVPSTVFKDYFMDIYPHFEDFWLFRKQFTSQYASFIFMTYMMCINSRQPQKIHINQGSGNVWTSEILPCRVASGRTHSTAYNNSTLDISNQRSAPIFHNAEPVPFRLTPNIQKLIGEAGLEGILSVYVLTIARALSEPEFDMEQYLSLFVRDEVISWFTQQHRPSAQDPQLREIVRVNVDLVVKRVVQLGQSGTGPSIASQYVLELISQAVNPRNLAGADTLWMAYL